MSRRRGPLLGRIEYYLLRILVAGLRHAPSRACVAILRAVGAVAFRVLPGKRALARQNVRRALDVSEREADHIVAGAYRTLALNIGESILVDRKLKRVQVDDFVTFVGAAHLEGAVAEGKGVLLAVAHYGAWEAMADVLARRFQPVWAVGRPLDNPRLAELVTELRERPLAGTLEKEGSGRSLVRLYRQGEIVALLLDQNAGRQGLMLDFFGRPTMQHKVSGVMATRFGVPVVPAYMTREPGHLRFRLELEAPIRADASLPEDEAVMDVMTRVSDSLEARIRAAPDQWLWLHDRWRKAQWLLDREARQAARAAAKAIGPAVAEGTNGS